MLDGVWRQHDRGVQRAKEGSKKSSACPYLGKDRKSGERKFLEALRAAPPPDIEDLVKLGHRYVSVVVLPAQAVPHATTR